MLLLQHALVIDPFAGKQKYFDILINDEGIIEKIGIRRLGPPLENTVDLGGKIVCPGLVDMHCHLREPGFEYKEDIESGTKAAAAGGFTGVACMANTNPIADSPEVIQQIIGLAQQKSEINVYPIAAVTKGQQGKELTDFAALKQAGAVAFSDDGNPIENEELLAQAFQKASELNSVVLCHSEIKELSQNGVIQEGPVAEQLGVPGQSAAAEYEAIKRELDVAEKTQTRIHIQHVSCKESVELIRDAKKKCVKVTAETCPHYFALTNTAVLDYGTNAKMNPPLRDVDDRRAIIEGLRDGTIDAIATDHAPHSPEEKTKSLVEAPFGIIGLETCFGLVLTQLVHTDKLTLYEAIYKMTIAPRQILGIPYEGIKVGAKVDLTIIDPEIEWTYDVKQSLSKSRNSPFDGWKLQGKAIQAIV